MRRRTPILLVVLCLGPAVARGDDARPPAARASEGGAGTSGAAPQRTIRLSVSPSRAPVGRRVVFRFRATAISDDTIAPPITCPSDARSSGRACSARHRTEAVAGAIVRFAGVSARTDSQGRATIVRTLRQAGRHRARATRSGFRSGRATVTARGAGRVPTFTG